LCGGRGSQAADRRADEGGDRRAETRRDLPWAAAAGGSDHGGRRAVLVAAADRLGAGLSVMPDGATWAVATLDGSPGPGAGSGRARPGARGRRYGLTRLLGGATDGRVSEATGARQPAPEPGPRPGGFRVASDDHLVPMPQGWCPTSWPTRRTSRRSTTIRAMRCDPPPSRSGEHLALRAGAVPFDVTRSRLRRHADRGRPRARAGG
jgi:hypothetical protein